VRRSILTAVLAVLVALLASCSGSDGGSSSSTTAAGGASTTAAPDGGGSTDGVPTVDQLVDALPAASVLGDGWSETSTAFGRDDNSEESTTHELTDQCPELKGFDLGDRSADDSVTRNFDRTDDSSLEVRLEAEAPTTSDDELDTLIDGLNACTDKEFTEDDGTVIHFTTTAARYTDQGEQGLQVRFDMQVTSEAMPAPLALSFYGVMFHHGPVGVYLSGVPGLDQSTFEAVPFDPAILSTAGAAVDAKLADLVGG